MSSDVNGTHQPTEERWTVQRLLEWTTAHLEKNGSESARLDAEILLAHSRQCERIQLYTQFNEELATPERNQFRELVKRRSRLEPVAYLVGFREFFSLNFIVSPDVLIPRPDTETLVIEALEYLKEFPRASVLDIGTGTGCIPICLASRMKMISLTAIDKSPAALNIAKQNGQKHQVDDRIRFLEGDLFEAFNHENETGKNQKFDLIVSNPPYIRIDEMETLSPDVKLHEPAMALQAGVDGLDIIRKLIQQAPAWLKPGGVLMMEMDSLQSGEISNLINNNSQYESCKVFKDLAQKDRVVFAKTVQENISG